MGCTRLHLKCAEVVYCASEKESRTLWELATAPARTAIAFSRGIVAVTRANKPKALSTGTTAQLGTKT